MGPLLRGLRRDRDCHCELLDEVGVDNVLFETDYPHSEGTFPNSRGKAHSLFGHLDDDAVYKIARGNAIKLLNLPFD